MSRILVVEPQRMLQQALVVALSPEHEGQVFARTPDGEALATADLLIIDAGALRGCDALSKRDVRLVQSCRIPVVWIDADTPPDTAAFAKLVRLAPPLNRDDLRAAVAECLRLSSAAEALVAPKPARAVVAKRKTIDPKPESVASESDKEFIDLVDVFEEAAERGDRAQARNKD